MTSRPTASRARQQEAEEGLHPLRVHLARALEALQGHRRDGDRQEPQHNLPAGAVLGFALRDP